MIRRVMIVAGILVLAALLAFPMRQAVHEVVIVPVSYLFWAMGLFYHSLPQYFWWLIVTILVLYLFFRSIFSDVRFARKQERFVDPPKGQVEQLSEWMQKAQTGVYNRWLVANRLGRLAYQILVQRDTRRMRSFFEPLDGPGWDAPPRLTGYLHAGLQGSFADYPRQVNPLQPPVKTPLDHDVREVVEFLESKYTKNDDHL